ncbi:MAG: hypothetical protein LBE84_11900 [Planctomycetota bacterium]|jgi:hypothetical protein|nr:hypothetical protein [Planctomycetota bacterium]
MEWNAASAQVFGAGWWLWAAAAISFLLLCLAGSIAGAWSNRPRGGRRAVRAVLCAAIPVAGLFPALAAAEALGFGILFHAIFFSLFCYVLGQRTGWTQGRDHMRELMGIESLDSVDEMQDRLLESGMRFPSRAGVVQSIVELAGKRKAEKEPPPDRPTGF